MQREKEKDKEKEKEKESERECVCVGERRRGRGRGRSVCHLHARVAWELAVARVAALERVGKARRVEEASKDMARVEDIHKERGWREVKKKKKKKKKKRTEGEEEITTSWRKRSSGVEFGFV
jgi:hypothetical protein